MQHFIRCKNRGFVSTRRNGLRDLNAKILPEVCKNIEIKPKLTPLKAEELDNRTANTTKEARLDLNQDLAPGVWERGQQAFLDLRVFDPNACRSLNKNNLEQSKRSHGKNIASSLQRQRNRAKINTVNGRRVRQQYWKHYE